jgi:hypothetical protein
MQTFMNMQSTEASLGKHLRPLYENGQSIERQTTDAEQNRTATRSKRYKYVERKTPYMCNHCLLKGWAF